jgi:hypothetical protein
VIKVARDGLGRREPEDALLARTGVGGHPKEPIMITGQGQRPDARPRSAGGEAGDDAAVIRRSRDVPEHFAVLFRRYAPEVQRYVRRRIGADAAR